MGEKGVLITDTDGTVRRADGLPLTDHDRARIAGRDPVQEQIDALPLAGPLPFPEHLPRERWPFVEIRDLTDHEPTDQIAPDMFFYLRDRREWLARDEAEAARIRQYHPRSKVTIDAQAYG